MNRADPPGACSSHPKRGLTKTKGDILQVEKERKNRKEAKDGPQAFGGIEGGNRVANVEVNFRLLR